MTARVRGSNPVRVTRMSGPDEKGVHALAPAPREPAPASPPADPGPPAGGGAVVAGIVWQALLAAGGYLVGHNLWHATAVDGFFAVVLGLRHGHRRLRITTPPSGWPVARDGRPQGTPTDATRADTRPPGRDPRR